MNLQQFRALQLPPQIQRLGEWIGGLGVLYWFWWVLFEKGALVSLTESPQLMEILLGLPLILIIAALYYTAVFVLLRVMLWLLWGRKQKEPMDPSDPSAQ